MAAAEASSWRGRRPPQKALQPQVIFDPNARREADLRSEALDVMHYGALGWGLGPRSVMPPNMIMLLRIRSRPQ